jgi:hypothetical protein
MGRASGNLAIIEFLSLSLMGSHEAEKTEPVEELPDEWWYRVYAAVIVTTVVVILLLWAFSRYFSS